MRYAALALLTAFAVAAPASADEAPKKLNVLFIAVDDLRPIGPCYGDPVVKTPNLERLAARGVVFNRAYCQQAVCSPSRSSLLTGRRPDTTRVYDLVTHFRTALPDVITLPQHFKLNGYTARSVGKIYHGGYDDPKSWSAPAEFGKAPGYGPEGQELLKKLREEARKAGKDLSKRENQPRGPATESPDVRDAELTDGATAHRAIELLNEMKDGPFFLAVGFLKPHLPFVAPKKYWDLYKPSDIRLATNPNPPLDAPKYAWHNSGELRAYHDMPKNDKPFTEAQARRLVHGYYAAVSFMDAQLGRVLDELDRLKLSDRTVIVLWGDHGWQLGEHGMWCKHCNYETSARAPLIVAVPGRKAAGKKSDALVEFVDIYPTLAEACGLPQPAGVEGTSLTPLLDDPARAWKSAAFSQYPRAIPGQGRGMGYSLRTDRYRLVEWTVADKDFREYELYDHQTDPDENVNLAKKPEHAEQVKRLTEQLRGGWKAAVPR